MKGIVNLPDLIYQQNLEWLVFDAPMLMDSPNWSPEATSTKGIPDITKW